MERAVKRLNGGQEGVDVEALIKGSAPAHQDRWSVSNRAKLIAGVGAFVVVAAAGLLIAGSGWVSTDDAFIEGHVVSISPKVAGHVLKVYIADNELVSKGQLLVELDPRDYAVAVDEARGEVATARASLRKADDDARRYRRLLGSRAIARQTSEDAQADALAARGTLSVAEAKLRQAELNLSYTRIEAPEAGRVTKKTVEEGAYVGLGQSLFALVPDEFWIVANFKETQLRRIRTGQRAEVSIDAYPGKLEARVDSLQSGTGARFSVLPAENATGNFVKVVQRVPVKIVIDKGLIADRLLAPGMSVEASVRVR